MFCWQPAAEAPNLYSLTGVKLQQQQVSVSAVQPYHLGPTSSLGFFFFFHRPHGDVKFNQVNSLRSSRPILDGSGIEHWHRRGVQHWLVSVASTAAKRKTQSVYIIMRQNSFLWDLMSRAGPSIEIPSAGCWFNSKLYDELVWVYALHQRAH